jgi:hypothetical protein
MTDTPRGFPDGLPVVASETALEGARRLREERAPLAAKIAYVAGQVARLPKTKEVSGDGARFRYTPVEDMAAAITGLCAELGLAMLPEAVDPLSEGADWRDPDPARHRTRWRYLYRVTWLVTDGNEQLRVQTMGEALDWSDKASNKAQTGARKYLYTMLFHLQTGDDPDREHGGTPPAEQGERPAQQQRRQAARQRQGSQQPAQPAGAPQAPAQAGPAPLSDDDARKVRRRFTALAVKVGADDPSLDSSGVVDATQAKLVELGIASSRQLLNAQEWLKACGAFGINPADGLPPDPREAQAAAPKPEEA